MITDCYDINTEPIVKLESFYGEAKKIVDTCLMVLSSEIHTHFLNSGFNVVLRDDSRTIDETFLLVEKAFGLF